MRVLERVWRKRKRRGGDRDNVCGGGDSIGKKNTKKKTKTKTKTYGCNEKIEKRNNIKNKKILIEKCYYNIFTINFK